MNRVWIQGAGEMASGVAVRLVREGHEVILAERGNPLAVRRLVCFSEAVVRGHARVEEVPGRLGTLPRVFRVAGAVTVVVDPGGTLIPLARPDVVVDARLTKVEPRALPLGDIPLIGLGPGFVCGRNASLVIETHRPAGPGRVIHEGRAAPDTGRPGDVGGHTVSRVVRAPVAGRFVPLVAIGDLVRAGQVLGHVGGQEVSSRLDGMVRGLVHSRTELSPGEKVGDVDPRGREVDPRKISDKALAIGGGVLAAMDTLSGRRETNRTS